MGVNIVRSPAETKSQTKFYVTPYMTYEAYTAQKTILVPSLLLHLSDLQSITVLLEYNKDTKYLTLKVVLITKIV